MLMIVAVAVAVPLVLVASVILGIRILRWSKKNAALSAAMMSGTFLDDVAGGRVETNDDSTVQRFLDWLGGKVDQVAQSHHSDSDSSHHDSTSMGSDSHHDSASHCGGGDSGGCCE